MYLLNNQNPNQSYTKNLNVYRTNNLYGGLAPAGEPVALPNGVQIRTARLVDVSCGGYAFRQ
jgi:hypothetical protein